LALLNKHRVAGEQLVIITATNEFVTRPIAQAFGVDELIAVELVRDAQGWYSGEILGVPSLREGKVQLTDGYVVVRNGEIFIIGLQIHPLNTASTHISPDKVRTRKLLMHKAEIKRLIGKVDQKGYTLVPINLHWKAGKIKCDIALAKGKAEHDKRDTIKDREGKREVERAMKVHHR
jgi:SsrA-binding protein